MIEDFCKIVRLFTSIFKTILIKTTLIKTTKYLSTLIDIVEKDKVSSNEIKSIKKNERNKIVEILIKLKY